MFSRIFFAFAAFAAVALLSVPAAQAQHRHDGPRYHHRHHYAPPYKHGMYGHYPRHAYRPAPPPRYSYRPAPSRKYRSYDHRGPGAYGYRAQRGYYGPVIREYIYRSGPGGQW